MAKITITVEQLEELLDAQKQETARHITKNLSIYEWFKQNQTIHIETAKMELQQEALNSDYPSDFKVLKKYL